MKVRSKGPTDATIVVITDTPTRAAWQEGKIMGRREMDVLSSNLEAQGVTPREVRFITPSSPLPQEAMGIEKKVGEWLSLHRDHFLQELQKTNPHLIVYLGKEAGRQLMGRPVKINSARGTLTTDKNTGTLVLPLLSPRHVLRRPEVRDIFDTDIRTVGTLKRGHWDASVFRSEDREARYRWVTNLEFLLDDMPGRLSFDVETVGLHWYRQQRLLTTQFCWKEGESVIVPMDAAYIEGWRRSYHEALDNLDTDAENYPSQKALLEAQIAEMPKEVVTSKVVARIFKQVKALLGNQEVRVVGHNLKFDIHAIRNHGVKVTNWYADTMQLAFAADDNMESKGLDDCIRRWVPAMAGYADCVVPETEILTSDMRKVPAGSLHVGDELCAFTAETSGKKAHRRRMSKSTVLGVQRLQRECLKITTASGKITEVSTGHLMLCKRGLGDKGGGWRWRRADSLTVGSVLKPFAWEDPLTSFDSGYVSGVLDGEGWVHSGRARLGVAQRDNPVLKKFKEVVLREGIPWGHSTDKRKKVPCVNLTFEGHSCFEMLQKFRPVRLLGAASWEGCGLPTDGNVYDRIVSIESTGWKEVVGLETSTQTIIADGLLSHNSFNRSTDKSRMDLVPPHKMRTYACGDTDAVFRLASVLVKEVRKDRANWNCFKRVQMPGLRAYVEIERVGFRLDRDKLLDLGKTLTVAQETLYKEMLALVPAEVRRAELEDPRHKGKEVRDILSFTRPDFIRRCLFSPEGLALEPIVFTKTTRNETGEDRLPSTSAKDHLGHFVREPLVEKIIEFGSLSTMRGRYVGDPAQEDRKIITPLKSGKWPSPVIDTLTLAGKPIPTARAKEKVRRRIKVGVIKSRGEDQWRVPFKGGSDLSLDHIGRLVRIDKTEATGFWQYLGMDGADDIHPGYFLHGTVTGRTSSRDPNGQNLPKHGALAPAFRRIFKPTPGYLFLEADLSQIELRLAAWVSGDPTMLHAYQTGQDLHALTAASTMGIPFEEFKAWRGSSERSPVKRFDTLGDYYNHQRFLAKGVNFGFVYGMWHTTFREYAKATFKVDISPRDAERYRNVFFETYPRLETYHRKMKEFVRQHGYVRALHGALRRLPSIDSDDEGVQKETERQSINSPIQRFGSDLLVMSASRLVRDAPFELIRPCGTIHDSMILEVREDYVEEGASAAKFYMESNPLKAWFGLTPPIPLLADVSGPSTDLAEMKEMKVTAVAPPWYQPQHDQ